jgi:hypothetical protein
MGITNIEEFHLPMADCIDADTGCDVLENASNGDTLVKQDRNKGI